MKLNLIFVSFWHRIDLGHAFHGIFIEIIFFHFSCYAMPFGYDDCFFDAVPVEKPETVMQIMIFFKRRSKRC